MPDELMPANATSGASAPDGRAATGRMSVPPPAPGAFDLSEAWELHPSVSVRPEPFGALLYHFGNRRLSFLKSRLLLDVVHALSAAPDCRTACLHAGVSEEQLPTYARALASLAAGETIRRRVAVDDSAGQGSASEQQTSTMKESA